jgi:hypothetical protein
MHTRQIDTKYQHGMETVALLQTTIEMITTEIITSQAMFFTTPILHSFHAKIVQGLTRLENALQRLVALAEEHSNLPRNGKHTT